MTMLVPYIHFSAVLMTQHAWGDLFIDILLWS